MKNAARSDAAQAARRAQAGAARDVPMGCGAAPARHRRAPLAVWGYPRILCCMYARTYVRTSRGTQVHALQLWHGVFNVHTRPKDSRRVSRIATAQGLLCWLHPGYKHTAEHCGTSAENQPEGAPGQWLAVCGFSVCPCGLDIN